MGYTITVGFIIFIFILRLSLDNTGTLNESRGEEDQGF